MNRPATDARTLNYANIALVSKGRIVQGFDKILQTLIADVESRPMDDKARKLTFEVLIKPIADHDDDDRVQLRGVEAQFKMKGTMPPVQSAEYPMLTQGGGVITFQPQAPGDPRQEPLVPTSSSPAPEGVDPDTGELLAE